MTRFLLCGLDDESYSRPAFSIYGDIESARNEAVQMCRDFDEDLPLRDDNEENRFSTEYSENGGFYVAEIHEISGNDDDYVCVYHHAYDGVEFSVLKVGTLDECRKAMSDDYERYSEFAEEDPDAFIDGFEAMIDDGVEWLMWDIIKVSEYI